MFSSAVSVGSRLNDWKTKPMCRRRSFVSARSAIVEISSPPIVHGAGGRAVEAGEQVHQRRLAGARRAHDGRELAGGHLERDAAQGVDGGLAVAVAAGERAVAATATAVAARASRDRAVMRVVPFLGE